MGFNTYGRRSEKMGSGTVVWHHVDELLPSGARLSPDVFKEMPVGAVLPAGTAVKVDYKMFEASLLTDADDSSDAIYGYTFNDVWKEAGDTDATVAVVTKGMLYINRTHQPESASTRTTAELQRLVPGVILLPELDRGAPRDPVPKKSRGEKL